MSKGEFASLGQAVKNTVQSCCQPHLIRWEALRRSRVALGHRLLTAALVVFLACGGAITYSILGVTSDVVPVPFDGLVYGLASLGAVLLVSSALLVVAGCRKAARRPVSMCIAPCCDSEADALCEMDSDEGLAAVVHAEFAKALSDVNTTLSRRAITLRHRWLVRVNPRTRHLYTASTAKVLPAASALDTLLDEESGAADDRDDGGDSLGGLPPPFFLPDDAHELVEWVQFQLPVVATTPEAVAAVAAALQQQPASTASPRDGERVRASARTLTAGRSMSSISVGREGSAGVLDVRRKKSAGDLGGAHDTSTAFNAAAALEVERILSAARMLADDDVVGAVTALEELLHPGEEAHMHFLSGFGFSAARSPTSDRPWCR
jgi:hypothetical protein